VGLWVVGLAFKRREARNRVTLGLRDHGTTDHGTTESSGPWSARSWSVVRRPAFALLAWLVLVEAGTEFWFRLHEKNEARVAEWALNWPVDNPTFRRTEISESVRGLMRSDQGEAGSWQEA